MIRKWLKLNSQPLQILIKLWIRDIHTFCSQDLSLPITAKGSDSKCHSDSVIQLTVNDGAMKWSAAVDDHAVLSFRHIGAHGGQIADHHIDPVGLLDFQFSRILDHGLAFCKAGHGGDHRQLVDERWDDGSADDRSM